MNRLKPRSFTTLAVISAFAGILPATGRVVFVASSSSSPISVITAGCPVAILAGLAVTVMLLHRARTAWQHIRMPAARQLLAQEPASPCGHAYEVPECADSDIISSGGAPFAKYTKACLAMLDRLIYPWPPKFGIPSARTRRGAIGAIGAVVCGAIILIVMLGNVYRVKPADSGIAGCAALLGAYQATPDYPRIRSQFAGSQFPDLRAAGTSYIDLVAKLRNARGTDGYETVWFYERLSIACAGHGRNITPGG